MLFHGVYSYRSDTTERVILPRAPRLSRDNFASRAGRGCRVSSRTATCDNLRYSRRVYNSRPGVARTQSGGLPHTLLPSHIRIHRDSFVPLNGSFLGGKAVSTSFRFAGERLLPRYRAVGSIAIMSGDTIRVPVATAGFA